MKIDPFRDPQLDPFRDPPGKEIKYPPSVVKILEAATIIGFLVASYAIIKTIISYAGIDYGALFSNQRVYKVVTTVVGVAVLGSLCYYLDRKRPKIFGIIQLTAALFISGYTAYSLTSENSTSQMISIEFAISLIGVVFLFSRGCAKTFSLKVVRDDSKLQDL